MLARVPALGQRIELFVRDLAAFAADEIGRVPNFRMMALVVSSGVAMHGSHSGTYSSSPLSMMRPTPRPWCGAPHV
jgi:hypothetical protein